jgi:hypothetical protein
MEVAMGITAVMAAIQDELVKANAKFPGFNSAHEGHSVIREEFEELWDHVKADTGYSFQAYDEAKQVAAMAAKYMLMVRERVEAGRQNVKGTK